MTATQTLEVLITPDGRTSVQTLGFTGATCREASKFLEEALGKRVAENLTAEFYQSQQAHQSQQQRH